MMTAEETHLHRATPPRRSATRPARFLTGRQPGTRRPWAAADHRPGSAQTSPQPRPRERGVDLVRRLAQRRRGAVRWRRFHTPRVGSRKWDGGRLRKLVPSGDRLHAVVGEHVGMVCDSGQLDVVTVGVDLEQVAPLAVEGAYPEQRVVAEIAQLRDLGRVRAVQVDPGNEGAAMGEGLCGGRVVGQRVDHVFGLLDDAQTRLRVERALDTLYGANPRKVVRGGGDGPGGGVDGVAQFAGQQLESDEHRRRPAAVEQFDDARDQVVGGSSARHRGFSTPVRRLGQAAVPGHA